MLSIRQNAHSDVLPDFRNLGVVARVLLALNLAAIAAALVVSRDLAQAAENFVEIATLLEPLLLACIVILAAASGLLGRLRYWQGCVAVVAIVLALTLVARAAFGMVTGAPADLARVLALAAIAALTLLGYFRLLAKAYS